jgi:formamidopyrimidine-DNA glycosylase
MPELPDVEGFRAVLAEHGTGRRVKHVEVIDGGVLRDVSARTDGPALLMHFGMTGGLHWADSREERHRYDRVVFTVDGGELRFRDCASCRASRSRSGQATSIACLPGSARTRWASDGSRAAARSGARAASPLSNGPRR